MGRALSEDLRSRVLAAFGRRHIGEVMPENLGAAVKVVVFQSPFHSH